MCRRRVGLRRVDQVRSPAFGRSPPRPRRRCYLWDFGYRVIVSGIAGLRRSGRQLDPPAPGSTGTGTGPGTGNEVVPGLETECPGTAGLGATPVLVEHPNSRDRHAKAATRRIKTLLGRRPPGQPRGDQCRVEPSEPKPQVAGSSSGQALDSYPAVSSPSRGSISARPLRVRARRLSTLMTGAASFAPASQFRCRAELIGLIARIPTSGGDQRRGPRSRLRFDPATICGVDSPSPPVRAGAH